MKYTTEDILDFLQEQEPRFLPPPFGEFKVKEKNKKLIIECNLINSLINPFESSEQKICILHKKSLKTWLKIRNCTRLVYK